MSNVNASLDTLCEVPNGKILLEQFVREIYISFSLTIIVNPNPSCSSESCENLKKIHGWIPGTYLLNQIWSWKWVQETVYLKSSPNDPEAGSELETTNITFPFRHERTQEPKFVAHL